MMIEIPAPLPAVVVKGGLLMVFVGGSSSGTDRVVIILHISEVSER